MFVVSQRQAFSNIPSITDHRALIKRDFDLSRVIVSAAIAGFSTSLKSVIAKRGNFQLT